MSWVFFVVEVQPYLRRVSRPAPFTREDFVRVLLFLHIFAFRFQLFSQGEIFFLNFPQPILQLLISSNKTREDHKQFLRRAVTTEYGFIDRALLARIAEEDGRDF